jgi:hypothetical protein
MLSTIRLQITLLNINFACIPKGVNLNHATFTERPYEWIKIGNFNFLIFNLYVHHVRMYIRVE